MKKSQINKTNNRIEERRKKMKRMILASPIIAMIMGFSAFADPNIPANNNGSATCTEPVLGTTSGTSNLQASWQANTLYLSWEANGQPYATNDTNAATCTYDGGITVPSTNPSRTGYTFAGWHVKTSSNSGGQSGGNNQTPITLSSLYDSGTINVFASKSLNPGAYCEGMDNGDWYGHDQGGDCTDNRFSGLNNGEWTVTMPNGNKVKGVATCSTEHPTTPWYNNNNTFTTDNFSTTLIAGQYSTDNSSGMQYCWCKATAGDTGNGYQSVAASSWVFNDDWGADDCAFICADDCADDVQDAAAFRAAVFGAVQ